jgi:hypothetical protein
VGGVIETSPGVAWTTNGVTFGRLLDGARERSTDGVVVHQLDVAEASFGLVLHWLPPELRGRVAEALQQECAAVATELAAATDPGDRAYASSLADLAALLSAAPPDDPTGPAGEGPDRTQ